MTLESEDIHRAFDAVRNHPKKLLEGFETFGNCEKVDDILSAECDFLFPCARDGVINAETAGRIKARYIVEGANGPTTPEAEEILQSEGVMILPDFLANSGGVIGSYFEWAQNLQGAFWSEEKGNFRRVWDFSESRRVTMRRAAAMAAIQRVAEVSEMRGTFL